MEYKHYRNLPDQTGHFGPYGGFYDLPKELEEQFKDITHAYLTISKSHKFITELRSIRKH